MIKGIVFDLDGVITETAKLHFLAWQEILKSINVEYSEQENDKLKGLSRIDTLVAIFKLKNIYNKFTEQEINQLCDLKNQKYLVLLDSVLNEKNVLPGIKNLLEDLKKHNVKLSIASSSFNAKKILEKTKLINYFDFIVNPETIKKGKPDPEIFVAAAKGINLEPNECIGIEDSLAGLKGIILSKMKSIAISHHSSEDFSKADLVLESTKELTFKLLKEKFSI